MGEILPTCRAITKELLKARFRFDRIGYSCRGTEFEAALGLAQLDDLEKNIRIRQNVARRLTEALEEFRDLSLPKVYSLSYQHTFMMYPIVLAYGSKVDKYDLCLHLEKNGIETRDMMPITNQPCYKDLFKKENSYSVAEGINERGFYIPCTPIITLADIKRIKDVFGAYLNGKKNKMREMRRRKTRT